MYIIHSAKAVAIYRNIYHNMCADMDIEQKIGVLGYTLPSPSTPAGNYLPVVESGGLVCISGQLPKRDGALLYRGKVGQEVSIEQGREAAVAAILCTLAAFHARFQDFSIIEQFLQIKGYVNATADFAEHPKVIDASSDFLVTLFGDRGRHTRAALGVASLPSNAPVEIECMLRITQTKGA